jgi:hypothetical protein
MCFLAYLSIISRRGPNVRGKIEMRKAVDGARLCQIGLGCADHVGVRVGVVTRAYARVDGQVGEQKDMSATHRHRIQAPNTQDHDE